MITSMLHRDEFHVQIGMEEQIKKITLTCNWTTTTSACFSA